MAARFLIAGGNGNWTSTTNWSATSGGASGASAPTSADDVTFDVNSGSQNLTIDTSSRTCKTLIITADYTGTLVMTNGLTVAGSVTLGANMGISGSGALTVTAAATLTSNGKTWPNALILQNNVTYTLADNWTALGSVTLGATANTTTINGFTLYASGSLTIRSTSGTNGGTTQIVMNGTGTFSVPNSGTQTLNVEINTAGTITLGTDIRRTGGVLKYTAGTVVSTGSTLTLGGSSTVTCNASGMSFGTISVTAGNQTFNGTHGFTVGNFSMLVAGLGCNFTAGNTYNITSSFIVTATQISKALLYSSLAFSEFYLNYSGSTQALVYCNATDVNSSGGSPIYVYSGTPTRTTNWTNLTQIGSGSGSGGIMRNPSLS